MPNPLLSWKNISVSFPTHETSIPSESINFPDGEVQENEFLWIDGISGAGKSTLMHLIKGIIPRYIFAKIAGEFTYLGQDILQTYPKELDQKTVYVFQNPYSQMVTPRAKEELIFGMENYQFSTPLIEAESHLWAEKFRLTLLLEQKTYTLSGGQCQRLVLASSLACNPRILLFDEPTAFMDPQTKKDFYELLRTLKGKFTIIVIDHNVPQLSSLCDKKIFWPVTTGASTMELTSIPPLPPCKDFHLNCHNISFAYPGKNIFQNMNFQADTQKIISILGENGSGKTTFFKILSQMLKLREAKIDFFLGQQKLSGKKCFEAMSIIYQNSEAQFYFDTVREELSFQTSQLDLVMELATLLGLKKTLDRSPYMLSEGQKRRLSILIAIAQGKPLILYDEPTYGQDSENISLITRLMLALKDANRLQIIITHDRPWAHKISDEVYHLENQKLVRQ
ncbi:MAG: ATP-binding cassette domain-containing protein [Bdellovibrio sp.]|nr:ATP-binding cassette domain-containing protein [Bdellovibrio sp.]